MPTIYPSLKLLTHINTGFEDLGFDQLDIVDAELKKGSRSLFVETFTLEGNQNDTRSHVAVIVYVPVNPLIYEETDARGGQEEARVTGEPEVFATSDADMRSIAAQTNSTFVCLQKAVNTVFADFYGHETFPFKISWGGDPGDGYNVFAFRMTNISLDGESPVFVDPAWAQRIQRNIMFEWTKQLSNESTRQNIDLVTIELVKGHNTSDFETKITSEQKDQRSHFVRSIARRGDWNRKLFSVRNALPLLSHAVRSIMDLPDKKKKNSTVSKFDQGLLDMLNG